MVDDFFRALPSFAGFERIADPRAYAPLPEDWVIGIADVVSSTDAIVQGRYKAVNTAGAAVISAVSNALGTLDFPYVFTGDGMCYAVSSEYAPRAEEALAATVNWVGSELGLTLRGGVMSVPDIRATGRDVRVARFAASANVTYAMFSGGGLAWAESELKAERLPPLKADGKQMPDLSGLSCRFKPIRAHNGLILSMIVTPPGDSPSAAFRDLVNAILALIDTGGEASRPVPTGGPPLLWPPQGFDAESRLQRRADEPLIRSRLRVGLRTLTAAGIMWAGKNIGGFSPERYQTQLVENSDFRKYEDGLMMTIDCTPGLADRIENRLDVARLAGVAEYGLHRQDSALITCVVPSPMRADHVHFVDGASGGYALAARALKRSKSREALSSAMPGV